MSDGGAFSMGFANAYRMMMDREEKKKAEEANRAIGQMYLESMRAPADAAVAPFIHNAIPLREKAFDTQVRSDASAMTDAIVANNPALTQRVAGTNAPVTPEMQAQFQQTNQANVAQSEAQAQGADQMLSLAKEKYGTAMFDRLGPIVASGKVPPQAMIAIIEKQIQAAEKTAIKQATANAVKILSDPKVTPEQKQAVLGQLIIDNPQAARGLAEAFGLKQQNKNMVIGRGGVLVDQNGNVIYQNEMQYAPRGGGGGRTTYDDDGNPVARPGKPEKVATNPLDQWAYDYEKKGKYIEDQAIYDAYMNSDFATPEMELKALEAKARLMQYWKMQGNGNPPASRPPLSEILK